MQNTDDLLVGTLSIGISSLYTNSLQKQGKNNKYKSLNNWRRWTTSEATMHGLLVTCNILSNRKVMGIGRCSGQGMRFLDKLKFS